MDLEREVYDVYQSVSSKFEESFKEGEYDRCIELYDEAFYDLLNKYFDEVMINAEDAKIKINRKSMVRNINYLFTKHIADLRLVKID